MAVARTTFVSIIIDLRNRALSKGSSLKPVATEKCHAWPCKSQISPQKAKVPFSRTLIMVPPTLHAKNFSQYLRKNKFLLHLFLCVRRFSLEQHSSLPNNSSISSTQEVVVFISTHQHMLTTSSHLILEDLDNRYYTLNWVRQTPKYY